MVESTISNKRYTYVRDLDKGPPEVIDVHHVHVRKNVAESYLLHLCNLVLILDAFFLFLVKDTLTSILLWSLLLGAFVVKLLLWNPVEKESVIILPAFGVQLETHYGRGRVFRRFIPISRILKPVLNECVTPVTCYWSLALIVCEEEELMLVFKELHPPVKMLVPIWKALCAANHIKEIPKAIS